MDCLQQKKLVYNFNKSISKNIEEYTKFMDLLLNASKKYSMIVVPKREKWKQPETLFVYTCLESFNIFNVTQIRSFLLALFDVQEQKLITFKNFKKILLYLEHYHFVFTAICSSRPSGLERRYSSYARQLRECVSKTETATCINNLITDLKGSIPSYEVYLEEFCKKGYTSTREKEKKLIQYILKKIERYYSTEELIPNSFTIEHILPESVATNYVGMIGNLLPLGENINSSLSNKKFVAKMQQYPESQYVTVQKFVEENKENAIWGEKEIRKRTEQLGKILYDNIIEG